MQRLSTIGLSASRATACLAALLSTSNGAAQTLPLGPTSPQLACAAPEHRQFDFWVGRWDVYQTGKAPLVAHSLIEKLYNGCAIRENWMPLKGTPGGSLNHYDRDQGRWHQIWMDASNSRVEFWGGLADGKMFLQGYWKGVNGPGNNGLVRMSFSKVDNGAVRQLGEISTDHGLSWKPFFDFTYKPVIR